MLAFAIALGELASLLPLWLSWLECACHPGSSLIIKPGKGFFFFFSFSAPRELSLALPPQT